MPEQEPIPFHWIITLQWHPRVGQTISTTTHGVMDVIPGTSRADVHLDIKDGVAAQAGAPKDAVVLFFALEPNRLT